MLASIQCYELHTTKDSSSFPVLYQLIKNNANKPQILFESESFDEVLLVMLRKIERRLMRKTDDIKRACEPQPISVKFTTTIKTA